MHGLELRDTRGFVQQLKCLLQDDNPMVVANSIAALVEIEGPCGDIIDSRSLSKILASLDACTEYVYRCLLRACLSFLCRWGQITILNCLTAYVCSDERECDAIMECVVPKLQHANYAVVFACVRLVLSKLNVLEVCFVGIQSIPS